MTTQINKPSPWLSVVLVLGIAGLLVIAFHLFGPRGSSAEISATAESPRARQSRLWREGVEAGAAHVRAGGAPLSSQEITQRSLARNPEDRTAHDLWIAGFETGQNQPQKK